MALVVKHKTNIRLSQAHAAAAQQAGAFDDEIVPLPSVMKLQNKETGKSMRLKRLLIRMRVIVREPLPSLAGLQPVFSNGQVIKRAST